MDRVQVELELADRVRLDPAADLRLISAISKNVMKINMVANVTK